MSPHIIGGGRKTIKTSSYVLLPIISGVLIPATSAIAQVVSADDGTNTTVTAVGNQFDITGGQQSADSTNVFQSFEQFNLGAGQTANFVTAADVQNVVGKVNGDYASIINGTLQVSGSDANLYLMNPSGILLGPDAQLNLPSSFTATTATGLGFEEEQFSTTVTDYSNLNGDPTAFHFETEQPGAVVNSGKLSVSEGESINLIGGTTINTGELNAPSGNITVAAVEGESTVRVSQAEQLLSLEVEANGITPTDYRAITATSIGEMLTGGELASATTLITNPDGSVQLSSAADAIDETGGVAIASGTLSAAGDTGGTINILGSKVALHEGTLDASGAHGGGVIRVGGDYQGNGPVLNATQTTVDEFSILLVNAVESGDGGRAIAWADDTTRFHGQIFGTGGAHGGNGGFAEVSGKEHLSFTGLANLSAPNGNLGNLLLDPRNIFITDGGVGHSIGLDDYIPSTTLENQVANIELIADNDIVIRNLADNELTLKAGGSATFIADANNSEGGEFVMEDLSDVIRGERKVITIEGAGIRVGRIDTSTNAHNSGGGTITEVGDVTLTSSQGVSAQSINTHAELSAPPRHSWDGGAVTITAANGDIDIAQSILTYSTVSPVPSGREAGDAGDITLIANNGSIQVSTAFPTTTEDVLQATSFAMREESGRGGLVSITALNGEVDIAGGIATGSAVGDEEAGDSGSVSINAGGRANILGTIDTSSIAGDEEAGDAGSVVVFADEVTIGTIDSRSRDSDGDGENAGLVSLYGNSAISVGSILATSTGGSDASIFLTGDQIDLTGGTNSVAGRVVQFMPFTNTRGISLGSNNGGNTLNIEQSDIDAIDSSVNRILIANPIPTGKGVLTIDQSIVENASSRSLIDIYNIGTLIGPTPNDSTVETAFRLEGPGSGQVEGAKLLFTILRTKLRDKNTVFT